MKKSETHINFP